ncbi:hypothetical protein HC028_16245 [Planosporangium flavigriseum]|uniref:Uncharacterized protein n=1 Tax=Planosporangium flavigriseum TaxID=373681 RepID=A0A8J3LPD6_9ACTN|nr:hypothetical protein [Planosporangium flavigriseum]NJC66042.1 hypothetical protein [Planosporangium flavigriseum]GIG75074.1 hypothetical protein Pfl04_34780 [Planosporangium flavigriseum]
MTTHPHPDAAAVGRRATQILDLIESSDEHARLVDSTRKYPDCWATFTGYPIIARFDLEMDAEPLFREALRVLCLKSAVYELTGGDEEAAELVVSAPVDEMVHAVLAQYTLCASMTRRLGIQFVHMTDRERFGWHRGDYTHECYLAAGWGEPTERYWIDADETRRRLKILNNRYASIGIHNEGRRHDIDFNRGDLALVVG